MAISYYVAEILSQNLGRTEEGYLVARDAVIGRTGFQSYKGRDLPQDEVRKLKLDIAPDADVDLYRSPEEVFNPRTLSSFEGKPVTDGHPPKFLAPEATDETEACCDYQMGHAQNVRKGKDPLESGEWPLLADLIITDPALIAKVEGGLRELSCGYGYHIAADGKRILQVDLTGNHVAVVPKGRAGSEARINDAAPEVEPGNTPTKPRKEYKVSNLFKHLLGLGLKAYAQDADPEKLAEAAQEIKKANDETAVVEEPKKTVDAAPPAEAKKEEPAKATDKRSRLHDALDRMLDQREESEGEEKQAQDADDEELKDVLKEFLGIDDSDEDEDDEEGDEAEGTDADEDETEEAKATDVDFFTSPAGFPIPIRNSSGYKRSKAGEGRKKRKRSHDSAEFVEPQDATGPGKGNDAADILKTLRPFVARSNDPKLKEAFNAASGRANDSARTGRNGSGSYAEFQAAASRKSGAQGKDSEEDKIAKIQAAYDARRGKNHSEVK